MNNIQKRASELNEDDLYHLVQNNTIVNACMQFAREGDCTVTQALIASIILLDEQNKELTNRVYKELSAR